MREIPLKTGDGDLFARLQKMPLFASLSESHIANIARKGSLRKYAQDEVLVTEGERDETLFLLITGELDIMHEGTLVGIIRRLGDVFGEMGVIDGEPRSATIRARTPVLCLALGPGFLENFEGGSLLEAKAVFYRAFCEVLATRLRVSLDTISDMKARIHDLEATLHERRNGNEIDR